MKQAGTKTFVFFYLALDWQHSQICIVVDKFSVLTQISKLLLYLFGMLRYLVCLGP